MQSAYFHDKELFIKDCLGEYFVDKKTGEVYDSAPFHFELRDMAALAEDLLVIVARDHAKTTSVCVMLILWLLINKVEESILLITAKGLGEDIIGKIRRTLETNKALRLIYGQLVPIENAGKSKIEKWRQRELQLLNGTEIKAITKGEPIRGRRPTKVFIDDPQEKKDVKNPRLAIEFYNWIWTTVYPVLSDSGSMVVLGTVLSDNCFVNMLKQDAKAKDFRLIEYRAILDFDPDKDVEFYDAPDGTRGVRFKKGVSLWPSRWPIEKLERRAGKMGWLEFKQEYLNIPMVINSAPVFRNEYKLVVVEPIEVDANGIKWFRELAKDDYYYIGVDPSKGRIDGDPCAATMRNQHHQLVAEFEGHLIEHLLAKLVVNEMVKRVELVGGNVLVIPESNVGLAFLDAAKEYDWFYKIYRKKTLDKVTNTESEVLGWYTTEKSKTVMISGYDQVMTMGEWEVSATSNVQIQKYYYNENGSAGAISPYHDDVLMSDMLSVQGIKTGTSAPSIRFL